ncbi:MAG: DUF3750 domain-containing protein, partial [Xanthomonadales bacterium]|nr:DUF3750 domain-containing protein [Xanthomonadales bacterium]
RPEDHPDAVIQVYSARTWGLKKAVSVHTWIAAKGAGEAAYRVYEVIGWRQRRGLSVVSRSNRPPDGSWYGNPPALLSDLRGPAADRLIDRIEAAADSYPWADEYTAWPGPNSNTFTAWIGRQVPELGLDLPSTAIGKDYAGLRDLFGPPVSGSGIQVSLYGLLSLSAGAHQGLEFSVLGLSLELDILDAAVEIPGFGRIGPDPV